MARPRKKGQLDWFKMTTQWDEKMDALLDDVGAVGGFIMQTLWMSAYRTSDGILDLSSPLMTKSIAKKARASVDDLERTIAVAVELELYDSEAWEARKLVSHAITKRLEENETSRDLERARKTSENEDKNSFPEFSGVFRAEKNGKQSFPELFSSPLLSSDLNSDLKEEEGSGEETTPELKVVPLPAPKREPYGESRSVFLTDDEIVRVKNFYTGKGLTIEDFTRGVEVLDGWKLDNPKKAASRRSDARMLTGWVYRTVVEEKTAEARLKRSTAPPQFVTAVSPPQKRKEHEQFKPPDLPRVSEQERRENLKKLETLLTSVR